MGLGLNEVYSDIRNMWEESKHQYDELAAEVKKIGEGTGETKQVLDRLNDAINDAEEKRAELAAKLDALNERPTLAAQVADEEAEKVARDKVERKSFIEALKTHPENIRYLLREKPEIKETLHIATLAEVKAFGLSDDTTGGYFAPPELVREVIRQLVQWDPIRKVARVRSTSNRSVMQPKKTGNTTATWVSEIGTRAETGDFDLGMNEVPNHELMAMFKISEQDLEDTEYDLEAEIRRDVAEQFSKAEAEAFLTGNGQGKPYGILTHADFASGGAYNVKTGSATSLKAEDIIKVVHDLPDPYADNAGVFMHRKTLGFIRGIRTDEGGAGTGDFLFQTGISAKDPSTLVGLPITTMVGMDQIPVGSTPAADKIPLIVGDMNQAYLIVDRIQMVAKRLVETYATTGQIGYIFRRRVGGQPVLTEALRVLMIE